MAKARCRPLRVERDEVLWLVTNRTVEERFWFLPLLVAGLEHKNRRLRRTLDAYERGHDKRIEKLVARVNAERGPYQARLDVPTAKKLLRDHVGAALARAQQSHDVRIYAVMLMSNHIHMVVSTPGKNLSSFMGYFKARVADSTNFLLGRRGPLWARRYDAEPILDDKAVLARIGYTLANPCSADLVERVQEWPGLCAAYGLAGATSTPFTYFDRTAWHKSSRPADLRPFLKTATLTLSAAPVWKGASERSAREGIEAIVREYEARARSKRRGAGTSALGVAGISRAGFEQRPKRPKRSVRPYFHTTSPRRAKSYTAQMNAIIAAHAKSSERFLAGRRNVPFPQGTYPPPIAEAA